jgi:2-phospho-L-lactate guanylyltransferase
VVRPAQPRLSDVHVILPFRSRDAAKSRLGSALDAEERDVLVLGMLSHTIHVLNSWSAGQMVHVVTADPGLEAAYGGWPTLRFVRDPGAGLNAALRAARSSALEAGASCVLMLPADLPLLSVASLDGLLHAADATLAAGNGRPVVVIAPADARTGTNALLLAPPDVIDPCFGPQSFEAHLRAAASIDASVQVVDDALLGFDLDTPDDLERLELWRLL